MITVGTWNLENLFRPGGEFGPKDKVVYEAKLEALAATINAAAPDVLGVQEVGDPLALADLVERLTGEWQVVLSSHFDEDHPIRVGVLSGIQPRQSSTRRPSPPCCNRSRSTTTRNTTWRSWAAACWPSRPRLSRFWSAT